MLFQTRNNGTTAFYANDAPNAVFRFGLKRRQKQQPQLKSIAPTFDVVFTHWDKMRTEKKALQMSAAERLSLGKY